MADIDFVLNLPPQQAIDWLKSRQPTAENYRNLTASELAKAHTVARMTDLDMLQDIKSSMIRAAEQGKPFAAWQKELLQHMADKGWLHPNGHNGTDIIDPKTGEIFGPPRRLENIYRTNMQSAYGAAQYQSYMQDTDNRPYWQYDAVGDARTRAAHMAMDGLIYRYDDPFWATFFPPNGYRCRCSVTALSERDMRRGDKILHVSGDNNLVRTDKTYNRQGDSYPTTAYKAPDGRLYTADKGFDYNVGRINYRPDLDRYDRALAQQFARADMGGAEFRAAFKQLNEEFWQVKQRLGIEGKPREEDLRRIRNTLSRQLRFAAGVLSPEVQALTGIKRATVWLSDDTLVKQVSSRQGQNFGVELYAKLPEIINQPDWVFRDGKNVILIQNGLMAVIKHLAAEKELFLLSFRNVKSSEIENLKRKMEIIKS